MQSSHLSAWLAHGCLSARQIWSDTLTYEAREGANESTYWLRFELLWRNIFVGTLGHPIDFVHAMAQMTKLSQDYNSTRFDG